MTSLPDAAAFLAQQWPVFPCNAEKRPVTENGFKDAVSDPDAARRLFRTPGAALIGVATGSASNLAVVDLDVKHGGAGLEWLAANQHRLPRTRTHLTRSGGKHLLFNYPAGRTIRNSASKIGPGVDVRGNGGYIIVPPSAGYTIADDAMPTEMPAWLVDLLDPPYVAPRPVAPVRIASTDGSPYGLKALERECAAVANAPPGTQETTLNSAGLKLGALVAGGELAMGVAMSGLIGAGNMMAPASGERPWSPEEVRKKVERAIHDGASSPRQAPPREIRHVVRIEVGNPHDDIPWPEEMPEHLAVEPGDEPAPIEDPAPHLVEPKKSRFKTLSISEVLNLPPPEWLITGVLTCGSYAGLYGPPGSLKSFSVLGMGLAIAYGDMWAGRDVKQMGVLYVAGEGARGLGKRIRAWQQHFGREAVDAPFRLLCDGVNLTSPEDTAELILAAMEAAEAEGQPIGLVIIDTVARAMVGADENSATDMGRFNEACAQLIRDVPGAPNVLAVHHTGKDSERGPRGSNSFHGGLDTMLRVTREEGRVTIKVEKQKDDEDGFEIPLKVVGIKHPHAEEDEKPYSLVLVDASADPKPEKARKAASLPPAAQLGLSALTAALERSGSLRKGLGNVPGNTPTVTEMEWRQAFYSRSAAPTQEAKAVAFKRAHEVLAAKGVALKIDGFAWIVRD